ncbi:maleylpyruvate isomerase family mycothiol-dependent enzyme [Kibdelosporangium philippinense]|uniref:Maleylpyruvate isomerase family mycothiol-dependent enzyme n=1 Tax=Kibdelosporangium philippinense TaxID=211113 RepID=A0ABS8Z8C6_9PSEU|nr:maleylpyruvate isomerase family mycothiol-dependent enzyme [Kibdelosporangium philippinense]MCE7004144.1 maleylpyruvate isomerase family mycothiol-dependent enzyme [Kibdelosporangium philippinense]
MDTLAAIHAERRSLADFLDTLKPEDWHVQSLCTAWTIHEVLAHITLSTRQSLPKTLLRVAKAKGNYPKAEADWAKERARDLTPEQLIAQLREDATSDKKFALGGRVDALVDLLVHAQDIARPLDRDRHMSIEYVVTALDHVWPSSFYGGKKRFAGMRLIATDADWQGGDGPQELHAAASELLMLATGRVARVSGPGAEEATARVV